MRPASVKLKSWPRVMHEAAWNIKAIKLLKVIITDEKKEQKMKQKSEIETKLKSETKQMWPARYLDFSRVKSYSR